MGVFDSPPCPEMATRAESRPIIFTSKVGNDRPASRSARAFRTSLPFPVGIFPNLKNPERISTQVSGCEKNNARNNRKPMTVTTLKVIRTFREL